MKSNGGPERLIAQMKSLNGNTEGFQIIGRFSAGQKALLMEFRPFKEFINQSSGSFGLKRSGEFYFNFAKAGFTGIVCFSGSHLSLNTDPVTDQVDFEVFLSDRLLNNINISEALYQSSLNFFQASVLSEEHLYR
jgi:S-adenosylmethionine/arginine decarboxylase-like enzyme